MDDTLLARGEQVAGNCFEEGRPADGAIVQELIVTIKRQQALMQRAVDTHGTRADPVPFAKALDAIKAELKGRA